MYKMTADFRPAAAVPTWRAGVSGMAMTAAPGWHVHARMGLAGG